MTLKEIVENLECEVLVGKESLERNVEGAYVSDLLSDVMGNADEGQIWVTLQTHKNVVAIASLKELAAVILVKGLRPDEEVLGTATEEEVVVLSTDLETFELSGKLYQLLNP